MTTKEASVRERQAPRGTDLTDQLIEPFSQLRSEVDRLFEGFPFRLPSLRLSRFVMNPPIEITETNSKYLITAELPGIDPENVSVTFEDGILRIAGEKTQQHDENERGYRLTERSYGKFERLIELPPATNPDKMLAQFRNGVLTIVALKKDEAKRDVRKIQIEKKG